MPEITGKVFTQKLESIFGIPFPELIKKNFVLKNSRYFVQKRILEMIVEKGLIQKAEEIWPNSKGQWNPKLWKYNKFGAVDSESNNAIRPSIIYHAIKTLKREEKTSFDFEISNKGRKTDQTPPRPTTTVELTCTSCKTRHKNNSMHDPLNLNLRVYACPKCGSFGKCVAKVSEAGIISFKAVVKKNGVRQELFVKSFDDLTPVEPPGLTEPSTSPLQTA